MADNITAPVPAPAPVSAPVSAPAKLSDVPSSDELFNALNERMGWNEKEESRDMSQVRQGETHTGTMEDLEGFVDGYDDSNSGQPETQETVTSQQEQEQQITPFTAHKFKEKVGDQDYDFEISSPEHLNKIVRKAIAADKVWKDFQKIQPEIQQLRESKAYIDRFESMLDQNPQEVLNSIVEEMDEDTLKTWLIARAEELGQPKEQRELAKKLKHAELLEKRMAAIEAREQKMQEEQQQLSRRNEKQTIETWQNTWRQKLSTSIPEQYVDLVNDQLYNSLREAKERKTNGETVTLKTLDSIFARKMRPVLSLVQSSKGGGPEVNRRVGEAIDAKKQQNLSRIQQQASSSQPNPPKESKMQKMVKNGDVSGIFDALIQGMDSGRVKISG